MLILRGAACIAASRGEKEEAAEGTTTLAPCTWPDVDNELNQMDVACVKTKTQLSHRLLDFLLPTLARLWWFSRNGGALLRPPAAPRLAAGEVTTAPAPLALRVRPLAAACGV